MKSGNMQNSLYCGGRRCRMSSLFCIMRGEIEEEDKSCVCCACAITLLQTFFEQKPFQNYLFFSMNYSPRTLSSSLEEKKNWDCSRIHRTTPGKEEKLLVGLILEHLKCVLGNKKK